MENIFFKLVNMSLTASVATAVVIILRLILKKAPKRISVALWALVALRLILPFSIESTFSLMPSYAVMPEGVVSYEKTEVNSTPTDIITVASPSGNNKEYQITASNGSLPIEVIIWLGGMAVMLAYALTSYLTIRKKGQRIRSAERQYSAVRQNFGAVYSRYIPTENFSADLHGRSGHKIRHGT